MPMPKDLWLPIGHECAEGVKVRSLLFSGADWQILSTQGAGNLLVARPELAQRWCDSGLLEDSVLGSISFGFDAFRSLSSQKKYTLEPVECGKSPDRKADAMAFAVSLRESRQLSDDASFHDAIYVERYSRLLPTWSLTPAVEDEVVLGTWITGGVTVSAKSFRRFSNLTGWLSGADLAEIIDAAGFDVPVDAGLLAKQRRGQQARFAEAEAEAESAMEKGRSQPPETCTQPRVFSLAGRPQLEAFFNEHVIDIIDHAEKYKAMGIEFPSAIVLHGPPGCGKTFAVDRLVEFLDWPSFSIDSGSVGSPYIHETSKKISDAFDKAIDSAPSVMIIDEMESFLSDRRTGTVSGLHHVEEVAEFLRRIPEATKCRVLVIAMTNMIDMIDPAILRRGRFDHIIEVGMPSKVEVESLLNALLEKLPKSEDLGLEIVVDALAEQPLSDAAFVVREAARLAAKSGKSEIDRGSMNEALKSLYGRQEKKSRQIGFRPDS